MPTSLRIRSKLALLLLGAVGLASAASAGVGLWSLERFAGGEAEADLDAAARTLNLLLVARASEGLGHAQSLALLEPLVDAVVARDRDRILRLTGPLLQERALDLIAVTDADGVVLARAHAPTAHGDRAAGLPLTDAALRGLPSAGVVRSPLFPLVAAGGVPLYERVPPYRPVGTVVAGFALDDDWVRHLRQRTGYEISLVVEGARVLTTLPAGAATSAGAARGLVRFGAGAETFRAVRAPIEVARGVSAVLEVARSEAALRSGLRASLLAAAGAFVLVGATVLGVALLLARRLSAPLEGLTRAAESLAAGDLDRRVTARSGDEVQALAEAFNRMADSVRRSKMGLAAAEEAFRDLFDQAPTAFFSVDTDGVIRRCNRAAALLVGAPSAEELVGRPMLELYAATPGGRERAAAVLRRFLAGEEIRGEELEMQRADGGRVWVSLHVNPARGPDGTVRESRSVAVDITARKRAEEALRSSREQLALLLQATPVVIYTARPGGEPGTTFVSDNVAAITGYEAREFVEDPRFWADRVHPEDAPRVLPAFERLFERGEVVSEYRFRVKDGSYRWMLDGARAVRDEEGRFRESVGYWMDVTERRRAEETVRGLGDLARELAEALDVGEIGRRVTRGLIRLGVFRRAALWLLDPPAGVLTCRAEAADHDTAVLEGRTMAVGEGVTGRAVVERRLIWSPDVRGDERFELAPWARAQMESDGHRAWASVPLVAGGEVLGALTLVDRAGRRLSEDEERVLSALGGQTALALRNARLLAEADRRRCEAETLAQVGRQVAEVLDPEAIAERIATALGGLLGAAHSAVYRLDPASGDLVLLAMVGPNAQEVRPGDVLPAGTGTAGFAVAGRTTVTSLDRLSDPRFTFTPQVREMVARAGLGAALNVPLVARGRVIGCLGAGDRTGRRFADGEVRLAEALADLAAVALDKALLHAESERGRQEAQSLAALARSVAEDLSVAEVGRRAIEWVERLYRPQLIGLRLARPDGSLEILVSAGVDFPPGHVLAPGEGIAGLAARERRLVFVEDVVTDPGLLAPEALRQAYVDKGLVSVVAVPLLVRDRAVGTLAMGFTRRIASADPRWTLLQSLADHVALALANARLYEDAERRRHEAETLATLGRLLTGSVDPQALHEHIVDAARSLLGAGSAGLRLATPEGWAMGARSSQARSSQASVHLLPLVPLDTGLGALVLARGGAVTSPDTLAEPDLVLLDEVRRAIEATDLRAILAVPLKLGERVVGVLSVADRTGRVFSAREVALLEALADQAVIALEKARLHAEAERRRQVAEALARVGLTLARTLEADVVGEEVVEVLARLLGAPWASIYRLEPDGSLTQAAGTRSVASEEVLVRLPRSIGTVARCIASGRPASTPDVLVDSEVELTPELRSALEGAGLAAALAVPLLVAGRVIGAVTVLDRPGRVFTGHEITLVQGFAERIAAALENARLFAELREAGRRLETLSRRLLDAQEAERRRIAVELHDEIGQALTAVKINLQTLEPLARDPAAAPRLGETIDIIDRLLQVVRGLSLDLRPSMLDDLGLVPALRWYGRTHGERTGMAVEFAAAAPAYDLAAEVATACFRVAQEALTNAARHARARRATVALRAVGEELELTVEDDGVGFDVDAALARATGGGSLGLLSMRERASLAGGRVDVTSRPGRGTEVRARFPLAVRAAAPPEPDLP